MKTDSAERVCLHVNLKTGSKETGRGFHPSDVSRSHFGGWRSLKLMVSFWKLDRSVRLTSEDATIKSRLEAKTSGVTHRQKSAWKLLQFKVTGGISRNQTEKVQTQSSLVLTVTPEAAPLLGSIIKSNTKHWMNPIRFLHHFESKCWRNREQTGGPGRIRDTQVWNDQSGLNSLENEDVFASKVENGQWLVVRTDGAPHRSSSIVSVSLTDGLPPLRHQEGLPHSQTLKQRMGVTIVEDGLKQAKLACVVNFADEVRRSHWVSTISGIQVSLRPHWPIINMRKKSLPAACQRSEQSRPRILDPWKAESEPAHKGKTGKLIWYECSDPRHVYILPV